MYIYLPVPYKGIKKFYSCPPESNNPKLLETSLNASCLRKEWCLHRFLAPSPWELLHPTSDLGELRAAAVNSEVSNGGT